ncbi:ANKRD50 [Mytilus edulis]|uniref:ANKRD50 n=1 Tax=Mytilus edulis TaxID=6550 RepID=A0A8S3SL09_MYTED|nr:ANKRD50 [Mytilus edulis]
MVSANDEHKYHDRLKADLENGKIHCCLNNAQMKYEEYRIIFRNIIKDLEINLIKNLINMKDDNGINAFIISCLRGYKELVEFFITVGADIDSQIGFYTPLTAACHDGHLPIVEILLETGSNINKTNTHGETPLYTACFEGHHSLVNCLIDKEADINKQNKYSRSSLYASCLMGHETIYGWTPLYEACIHGDKKTVQSLIRARANVNMQTNSGEIPLVAACHQGHGFIIQVLLDEGADINQALFSAVQNDYIRAIKILLYKGGDASYKGVDGKSLISLACEHGSVKAVKILLEKGADFREKDVNGKTLIHVACNTGSVDLVQILIDKGLDLIIHDIDGRYPLFVSLNKGFNYLSPDIDELIPLFDSRDKYVNEWATYYPSDLGSKYKFLTDNHYKVIQLLIENGADANKADKKDRTPLLLAKKIGM